MFKQSILSFLLGCILGLYGAVQASDNAFLVQKINGEMEALAANSADAADDLAFVTSVRALLAEKPAKIVKATEMLRAARESLWGSSYSAPYIEYDPRNVKIHDAFTVSVVLMFECLYFVKNDIASSYSLDNEYEVFAEAVLEHALPLQAVTMARAYRAVGLERESSFAFRIPPAVLKGRSKEDLQVIIPGLIEYQREYIDYLQNESYTCFREETACIVPGYCLDCWAEGIKQLTANKVVVALTVENLRALIAQAAQVGQYIQTVLPCKVAASFEHDKACIEKLMARYEVEEEKEEGELVTEAMSLFFSSPECATLMFSQGCWQELLKAAEPLHAAVQLFVDRGDLDEEAAKGMRQQLTEVVAPFFACLATFLSTLQRVLPGLVARKVISQTAADELLVRFNDYFFSK
jgi:hypothetical protein